MNDFYHVNGHYDWGIDSIVEELRDLRLQSLETRSRRDKPPKLPSRKELQLILEGLGAVLFPNRLGLPDLNDEGIDYFVGHTLENLLRKLYKQIMNKLLTLHDNLRRNCRLLDACSILIFKLPLKVIQRQEVLMKF